MSTNAEFSNISRQEGTVTIDEPGKNTGFVLLKRKAFWWQGYVYCLEKRDKGDSYGGRLGLFGGTQDTGSEPDYNYKAIAVRELQEELKLSIAADDLTDLGFTHGPGASGSPLSAEVFVFEDVTRKQLKERKLANAVKEARELNKKEKLGDPIKIRRVFFRYWFMPWHKLTPTAAFALLTDAAQDRRKRKA